METTYTGTLQISVVSALGMTPIPGATVTVSYTGDPDSPLETMTTDESGQTPTITLDAPPERAFFISGYYGTALFGVQHSGDCRRL